MKRKHALLLLPFLLLASCGRSVEPTHDYESSENTTSSCSDCSYSGGDSGTSKSEHNYSSTWSHDQQKHWHACTDKGYENLKSDEANHVFEDVITPPTHKSGGYTTHTCTVCGYSYVDGRTDRLKYNVRFDLSGGTTSTGQVNQIVYSVDEIQFFFDLQKADWNFRGWSYNGTKIFDEKGNKVKNITPDDNMVFVALFTQTTILTITTNLEGAGNITGEGEYPYNTYVDVSAYPNQGYEFVGWFYQNTLLSNTNEYKYMMWSEDVTLEARFKLASFLMDVHTNNSNYGLVLLRGNAYNDYQEQYQEYRNYTSSIKIAAYSKTDVRFLGWYDTDNKLVETNAVYTFVMPNHDYTLEAKWNYFTVDYVLNGGTNSPFNPTSYTIDSGQIALNEPTRTGYDFLGWTYNGKTVTEVDPAWIENVTLVANWRAHTYSITYELNGGTNNSSNPTTYTIESNTITLKDPSRNGYDFSGWYKTSAFSDQVTEIIGGSHGDLVLYAKWTPIVYSITYNLDGGTDNPSNPSTYTIESSFALSSPSKTGYTFLGWFDDSGNKVTSIAVGTTGALTLTAHWNEGNEYTVTLDANGGEVSEALINVQYNHSYSLPASTRLGYTFDGWYDGSAKVNSSGTWKYTTNKTFAAHWTAINYSINYTLNGGTNSSNNPSTYTIESAFDFADATKTGYQFAGWFDDGGNRVSSIAVGTTGSLTLTAHWTANLNSLSVTSEDTTKGTVAITSGSGYSDESITVVATPVGDCVFKGWYHEDTKVSNDATYTFTMPTSDYSLVAHFFTKAEKEEEERAIKYGTRPILSEDGKTITYGLYPQKNVNDSSLITELNKLTTPESNGWYLYNDDYYAKRSAKPWNSDYKFDNGTTIVKGTTYWFKCEPITWNVLSNTNGEYYILSSVLLDAHCYYNYRSDRTIDGKTIEPNNYEYSDIRTWLNNYFYNSAFALGNTHIQTTTVDNSAATTNSSTNSYACGNTQDKVFLPSYKDYINSGYGFSTSASSTKTRYCRTTDWARARGSIYDTSSSGSYQYNGIYWTRSPRSGDLKSAWHVSYGGDFCYVSVDGTFISVRPALSIKIA